MSTHSAIAAYNDEHGSGPERRSVRRVAVLGTNISAVDLRRSVEEIAHWIAAHAREYVCVTGAHGVFESDGDQTLTRIHNEAGMVVPDGMPMVWAGRLAGLHEIGHVRGSDLMLAVLERGQREGWRSFFYGGADGVPELLSERLVKRYPEMVNAGCYSPPFRPLTPLEDEEIVEKINAAEPEIIWVGLSTPKQERWMAEHRDRLNANVLIGVGAAFDYHAGLARQAPLVMQRTGTEWLYRLVNEPRRLWRRYLIGHSRFVWRILRRWPDSITRSDE